MQVSPQYFYYTCLFLPKFRNSTCRYRLSIQNELLKIFSQHLLKQHFQYNLLAKNIRPSMEHDLELIPN